MGKDYTFIKTDAATKVHGNCSVDRRKNNMMEGEGVYTWPDGRKYEGTYKNDLKDGFGKYTYLDGRVFIGNWVEGKKHGKGKLVLASGTSREGYWENDKRIEWLDEDLTTQR
jgi:hypothetical protein